MDENAAHEPGSAGASGEASEWYVDAIGPFYDSSGARHQLGDLDAESLAERRRVRTVLAVQTGAGEWLYPAWQFTGHGTVHAKLLPALEALSELDGWVAATWLVNPRADLSGLSPRNALAAGANPEEVAVLAREDMALLRG